MSDNKLLAENTVRRFMKLANVAPLTDNFVSEMYGAKHKDEEEKNEEAKNDEDVVEESEEENQFEINEVEEDIEEMADYKAEDEEEDLESDLEPEGEEEPGQADLSLSEEEAQVIIDLGKRLEEAMAGEMSPADDVMGDMGDLDSEETADMSGEPEAEDEDEEIGMMAEEKDAIVQEVLKRVAKRLVAKKLNRA